MSDEYLNRRIADLEKQVAEANAEAKKRRVEGKKVKDVEAALRTERDKLAAEIDALKKTSGITTDEWKSKYDDLSAKVRDRDHRDAFRKAAAELKVRPEAIDDLFALSGYKAEDDQVDEAKLKGLIGEAVQARPYLLHESSETEREAPGGAKKASEPLTLQGALDAGRAARDTGTGKFTVRESQLKDPRFTLPNTKAIAEASKAGNLVILPD